MNVLILTPDRVGSTLLQRLITVYMLRKGFDQPVINLHELTNGLIKYYNPLLETEVLGRSRRPEDKGYFQSLPEIIDLLKSVDHYKTSRLAHYHLVARQDSREDQLKFYDYLNKNFYIIGCRRENLFEHALSWIIFTHSKTLNVYSPREKIDMFQAIYSKGIIAHKEHINNYLNKYKNYIEWSDRHFDVQSYFEYDKNIKDIENYILNLDFMHDNVNNKWEDMFGLSWRDYNTCSRLIPNLLLDKPTNQANKKIELYDSCYYNKAKYEKLKGSDLPVYEEFAKGNVPALVRQELDLKYEIYVDDKTDKFLKNNLENYQKTAGELYQLVDDGFLPTSVPLKLQSLKEKKKIIKNYSDCLVWYNEWVEKNNFGEKQKEQTLDQIALEEEINLNLSINKLLK